MLKKKPDDPSSKRISPWCGHTLYWSEERSAWFCKSCQVPYVPDKFTESQVKSWLMLNPVDKIR